MKKIFVRKVFCYDPTVGGKYSKYDGYRETGLQKLDVGISRPTALVLCGKPKTVYCSALKRATETAELAKKLLDTKDTSALPELNEIIFDLSELLTQAEYQKYGSNLVRKRFIEAFADDSLAERRDNIKKRMDGLFQFLRNQKHKKVILVSHSFYMKILQSYLIDESIFDKPERLKRYFDASRKTFEFGEGFEFSL